MANNLDDLTHERIKMCDALGRNQQPIGNVTTNIANEATVSTTHLEFITITPSYVIFNRIC